MKRLAFLIMCLFLLYQIQLFAVSAYPWPVLITQPDGSKITVNQKGDEYMHWLESTDGKTLVRNSKGFITYASLNQQGNIVSSEMVAHDITQRSVAENQFLLSHPQKVFYSDSQVKEILQKANVQRAEGLKAAPTPIGNIKILVILMGYPDTTFIEKNTDFNSMFNQTGYNVNHSQGSVHDYFVANSYNKLSMNFDVYGSYTSIHPWAFYGKDTGIAGTDQYPDSLVYEAIADVHTANPTLDFSQYAGIHVVFAGHGQEFGGVSSNAIWSHEGHITPTSYCTIDKYAMTPEFYGNYSNGSTISTIGVFCHELTHVIGAPDFYDTDNNSSNRQYVGTGLWDLMAEGNWNYLDTNNSGTCPADINMYQKIQFGWVTPTVLNSTQTISDMPNSEQKSAAYLIKTTTQNERYILENRQLLGYDAALPGHGLLIYHAAQDVDDIFYNINITHPQKMYPVCASASSPVPSAIIASYGSINSSGCPFPGTSSKTSFTNLSTPAILAWNRSYNYTPVTNITEDNTKHTVSFQFMNGIDVAPPPLTLTDTLKNSNLILAWTKPIGWSLIADTLSEQHWDGACSDEYLTYGKRMNVICAQQFSADALTPYVGKTWSAVRFFPSDTTATHYYLQLYTVSGTTATRTVNQSISGVNPGTWNTFYFTNPIMILSNLTYAVGIAYSSPLGSTLTIDNGPAVENKGCYGDLTVGYTGTLPASLTFDKLGSNNGFENNFNVRGLINLGSPLSYNVYFNTTLLGNVTNLKDTIVSPQSGDYAIKTVNSGVEGINSVYITYSASGKNPSDTDQVHIYSSKKFVIISGAIVGNLIQVYSPLGILYKAYTATTNQETFTLPSGLWIVRVDKRTRKVVIP
jgi:M6 family metalloprotease-like protein